jgi:hypothetical protein
MRYKIFKQTIFGQCNNSWGGKELLSVLSGKTMRFISLREEVGGKGPECAPGCILPNGIIYAAEHECFHHVAHGPITQIHYEYHHLFNLVERAFGSLSSLVTTEMAVLT